MMAKNFETEDSGIEYSFTFDMDATAGMGADYPMQINFEEEYIIVYREVKPNSNYPGLAFCYDDSAKCRVYYGDCPYSERKKVINELSDLLIGLMEECMKWFNDGLMKKDYYGYYYPKTIPARP
jgi:hypothetical protein